MELFTAMMFTLAMTGLVANLVTMVPNPAPKVRRFFSLPR